MKARTFVLAALLLTGCASLGYQSNTLNLPRDQAMVAIGQAHQACKDKKIPKDVCTQVDALVAAVKSGGNVDLGALIGLFGQLAPLLAGLGA